MNGTWLIYHKATIHDLKWLEQRFKIRVQGISKKGKFLIVRWVYLRTLVDLKRWDY